MVLTSLITSVNSVDVLYAAFPTFLYINATWAQALLTPLLEYQDSNLYFNPYAAQDLGKYLNGHQDAMLIVRQDQITLMLLDLGIQCNWALKVIVRIYAEM